MGGIFNSKRPKTPKPLPVPDRGDAGAEAAAAAAARNKRRALLTTEGDETILTKLGAGKRRSTRGKSALGN